LHTTSQLILPALSSLSIHDTASLTRLFTRLRSIYLPPIIIASRGSGGTSFNDPDSTSVHRFEDHELWPASPTSEGPIYEWLGSLRSDAFERSFVVKWLSGLISRFSEIGEDRDAENGETSASREELLQNASALLAICSGSGGQGSVSRSIHFMPSARSIIGSVRVELHDAPFDSGDVSSVGLQTWGSSYVLCEMIVESPRRFGLPVVLDSESREEGLRILELGAGTGLLSLVLAKVLEKIGANRETFTSSEAVKHHIFTTDYHQKVLDNLRANVAHNFPANSSLHHVDLSVHQLDWSAFTQDAEVGMIPFDLIFAADVVYEAEHCGWLKACVSRLLRRPSSSDVHEHVFHLVIPLRSTHTFEIKAVEEAFPLVSSSSVSKEEGEFQLVALDVEEITRKVETGGQMSAKEMMYRWYKIGWVENKSY